MKIYRFNLLLIIMCSIICGCCGQLAAGIEQIIMIRFKRNIIAVLPVENKSPDGITSQLFRSRLLEELYFKGYSKLPLETIDKKLELYTPIRETKDATAVLLRH